MNFFRLRFLNTFLLFLTGIILGFIIKEKFCPTGSPAAPAAPAGQVEPYAEGREAAPPQEEETAEEPYPVEEAEPEVPPARVARVLPPREEAPPGPEIVIEPHAPEKTGAAALPDAPADFFSRPQRYAGRDVELSLQLITAKRSAAGWRLNFVYSEPARKIDYLYVDDSRVLGENPDLRIGYAYRIRFSCGKGDSSSGNTLLAIEHTGQKAAWATGLSALE